MAKQAKGRKSGKKKLLTPEAYIENLWRQAEQYSAENNLSEEEKALRSILNLIPDHYGSLVKLSYLALRADKKPMALEYAKRAVQANHGDADGHLMLGEVLSALGLTDLAEGELTIAQMFNNKDSRIHDALGWVYAQQGRNDEAEAAFRRAIELAPGSIGIYYNLASNKKFQAGDPDITAIEKLREHEAQYSQEEKVLLHFMLGKIYHDCGEYDSAFMELELANNLKRTQIKYSPETQLEFTNLMLQTLDEDFAQRFSGGGCNVDSPVFVVGMPRSGTTLVESLLCRHPDISGIGEVPYIKNLAHDCGRRMDSALPYPHFLSQLSPQLCQQLGEEYVQLTHQFAVSAKRIVDKMPDNFMLIGFILALLPNARIIHCTRNPIDTCLSIYQQYFTGGMAYAYDLKEIADYYVQYHRFMDHWHQIFPDKIYDVVYEDLVADSEKGLRQLIEYCDLPWDDQCLRVSDNDMKIRTASVWQARQPVYNSSVQRWRHYQKHLGPLLEVLQPILLDQG